MKKLQDVYNAPVLRKTAVIFEAGFAASDPLDDTAAGSPDFSLEYGGTDTQFE